jgi:hypothetical protein
MTTRAQLEILLKAARADAPPRGNEARLLVALGLPPAAPVSSNARILRSAGGRVWLKWMGATLLVGALVAPSVRSLGRHTLVTTAEPPAIETSTIDASLLLAPSSGYAAKDRALPHATGHRPVVGAPRRPLPLRDKSAVRVSDEDELTKIREAKQALRRADPMAALAELDAYARTFPAGHYAQEAAVVRVEALLASRQTGQAVRAADAFEEAYPQSAYADHLRLLVTAARGN